MMNRRHFILGSLAATALPKVTLAQTPEATPASPLGGNQAVVVAGRSFEGDSTQTDTFVMIFDSKDAALEAFEQRDTLIESYLSTGSWREGTLSGPLEGYEYIGETVEPSNERLPMSSPDIGDNHAATVASIELHGYEFKFTFYVTQKDTMIYFFVHIAYDGLGFSEMFELAENKMSFAAIDSTDDEQVFSLLPSIDEMPVGYVMLNEWIIR